MDLKAEQRTREMEDLKWYTVTDNRDYADLKISYLLRVINIVAIIIEILVFGTVVYYFPLEAFIIP